MIRKYLMLLLAAVLLSQSCKNDDFGPTLNYVSPPAITLPAAGASFVLKEADAAKPFSDFNWTSADFGFASGAKYTLEMDVAGNNFANPTVIGAVNGLVITGKTVGDINTICLVKGLPGNKEASMELRVTANVNPSVNTSVNNLVSKSLTIKLTPYTVQIPVTQLQVPGDYQGWDPTNSSTVIFSTKGDHKYEGYIYFPNATTQYKYCDGPSWTTNYGDDGADGTLNLNGANINVTGIGLYKLNVNLPALTHTYLLTNWSVIGDATAGGWNTDTDMVYNSATGVLEVTTDLVAGSIKFRANHDWGVNLGDDGADKILDYNGANIAVAAPGNYTITLALNVANYTYTIHKN